MSKFFSLALIYFGLLLAFVISPKGLSDYNAYVLLLLTCVYLVWVKSHEVYRTSILLGAAVILFSVFLSSSNILYVFADCAFIFYVIGTIYIGCRFPVKAKETNLIRKISLLVCLLSFLGILNPAMYQTELGVPRYLGLFHGVNFSASIFALLSITAWEFEKKGKRRTRILILLAICFIGYMWASETRSLLFVLPYWAYQLYISRKTRTLSIVISVIAILIYLPVFSEQIANKLRLEEDDSFNTRSVLYARLWMDIKENYAIIPHGSYTATAMIREYTRDPGYSAHNDFLQFIYEWGAIFYVFCIYLILKIRKYVKLDVEFLFILLALASCALHNMLSTVYLWIPFMFILVARRRTSEIIKTEQS